MVTRNEKIAGGVAAVLVLALVGVGIWWFFIRKAAPSGRQSFDVRGLSWNDSLSKQQLRVRVPAGTGLAVGDSVTLSNVMKKKDGDPLTALEGLTGTVASVNADALLCGGTTHKGDVIALSFDTAPYGSRQWCNTLATATFTL